MKRLIILAFMVMLVGAFTIVGCGKETETIVGPTEYDTTEVVGPTKYDSITVVEYDTTVVVDTVIQYDSTTVVEYDTTTMYDTTVVYDVTVVYDTTVVTVIETAIVTDTLYVAKTSNSSITVPTYHCGGPSSTQRFSTTILDASPGSHWSIRISLRDCSDRLVYVLSCNSVTHSPLFTRDRSDIHFNYSCSIPPSIYNIWKNTQIEFTEM